MAIYLDDKRLVKQLLANDEQAFDRFFSDNFARLYRFALYCLAVCRKTMFFKQLLVERTLRG